MVKFTDTIPGTGVNLAKRIRVLTKKIMDLEYAKLQVLSDWSDHHSEREDYIARVNERLIVIFAQRKDMIDSLIGFYALDSFAQDFEITYPTFVYLKGALDLRVSRNLTYCKGKYKQRVKEFSQNSSLVCKE